jgi:hypothetical protein
VKETNMGDTVMMNTMTAIQKKKESGRAQFTGGRPFALPCPAPAPLPLPPPFLLFHWSFYIYLDYKDHFFFFLMLNTLLCNLQSKSPHMLAS